MDSDVKTRITPMDDLKFPAARGQDCLVVIYSSDARMLGRRHVMGAEPITVGRGSENTVVLENDSVSRRHARIELDGGHYSLVDLGSTNGTYVNDEMTSEVQLRRGDQIKVGETIFKYLSGSDVEAQYHETIYRMTIIDGLTEVHNKRFLMETLEREIPRARRHERPLTLVLFDMDYFKRLNDGYGHLAGDHVLKEVAQVVKGRLRPDDVIARYGGEEFAIVLPETSARGGGQIAEQVRALVAGQAFEFEHETIRVTVSLGVAELKDGFDVNAFIRSADEALYASKHAGRDRVTIAS